MAYVKPWNESLPDGSESAATIDTIIADLKTAIRERLEDFFPDWTDEGVDPKRPASGYPRAIVTRSGTQNIANNTPTKVEFSSEVLDQGAMVDLGAQVTRITIPANLGGMYLIHGSCRFDAGATGFRQLEILKNGTSFTLPILTVTDASGTTVVYLPIMTMAVLAAGDYIELQATHTQGTALDIRSVQLSAVRLST